MRKLLILGLVLALTSLACGDDDDGPTASPFTPNLAGNWVGEWTVEGVVIPTTLRLRQDRTELSGTFELLSSSFAITGSVNSSLRMQWTIGNAGCGYLVGDGTVDSLSPSQITGTIDFNQLGCSTNRRFIGPVVWRRSSSLSAASSTAASSTLQDLAKSLEKEMN